MSRAFEPFFTTKPHGRGTGLGLSTIYGFVKQSNGNVTIYSEPGKGTTINLYLPRHGGELSRDEGPKQTPDAATATGETILVVEDNPEVRAVGVSHLKAPRLPGRRDRHRTRRHRAPQRRPRH